MTTLDLPVIRRPVAVPAPHVPLLNRTDMALAAILGTSGAFSIGAIVESGNQAAASLGAVALLTSLGGIAVGIIKALKNSDGLKEQLDAINRQLASACAQLEAAAERQKSDAKEIVALRAELADSRAENRKITGASVRASQANGAKLDAILNRPGSGDGLPIMPDGGNGEVPAHAPSES